VSLRAVIFDFDFTLADSGRGFVACHAHACEALALPPVTEAQAMAMMGTPLPAAFRLLFPDHDPELGDEYVRLFRSKADEVMTDLTDVYPFSESALRALRSYGFRTGIVSQKDAHRVRAVLERDRIADCIDVLVGGLDVSQLKPHPEGLLLAASRLGVSPADAIYVGDTVIDAQAAANAGLGFVAVLTGVTPAPAFTPFGPLAVLPDAGHLPDFCKAQAKRPPLPPWVRGLGERA